MKSKFKTPVTVPEICRLITCFSLVLMVIGISRISQSYGLESQMVILTQAQAENIGIETEVARPRNFEETLFALGKVEVSETRKAVISTRVSGRVIHLAVHPGDAVSEGQQLVRIETLSPGDPPPSISLESPLNGRVMESHITLGEPVDPSRHLMTVADLRVIDAVAHVPEEAISFLAAEMNKNILIQVPAAGDAPFSGKLERIGSSVNPDSATLEAHYLIDNSELKLLPGMRAEFNIPIKKRTDVLAIPNSAIQETTTEKFVFVADFDLANAYIKAPVKTGFRNATHTEIVSGLFPHDEVVTRGAYALSFAGDSGLSLKEALDAAHGHEHNEDGSELTAAQKREAFQAASDGSGGLGSDKAQSIIIFLGITCLVLTLLLLLSLFNRNKKRETKLEESA